MILWCSDKILCSANIFYLFIYFGVKISSITFLPSFTAAHASSETTTGTLKYPICTRSATERPLPSISIGVVIKQLKRTALPPYQIYVELKRTIQARELTLKSLILPKGVQFCRPSNLPVQVIVEKEGERVARCRSERSTVVLDLSCGLLSTIDGWCL